MSTLAISELNGFHRKNLAPKSLIIDEMGYVPQDDVGATIFFLLMSVLVISRAAGIVSCSATVLLTRM